VNKKSTDKISHIILLSAVRWSYWSRW
jgi:hypothetical protein